MDYKTRILAPLSDDAACGTNLEEDAQFQNFFFLAQGTPERYDGENTLPAEPPDWREIKKKGLTYLEGTKDLKLISVIAQAVLNTEGLVEFQQCLTGLTELIESQWEEVFPPLDEDDGDPMERMAALSHLNEPAVYQALKALPIVAVKGIGTITLASVDDSSNDSDSFSDSQLRGIFNQNKSEEVQLFYDNVRYSHESLTTISACFVERSGHEYAVDFSHTLDVLAQILAVIEKYADLDASNKDSEENEQVQERDNAQSVELSHGSQTTQKRAIAMKGEINSRADVEACLEDVIAYYAKYESSSPIPVLLNRALKLVHKDFLAIMQDIYPDALPALRQLGGIAENDEPSSDSENSDDDW